MRTDDLIRTLAADNDTRAPSPGRALVRAMIPGLVLSAVLFLLFLGPRSDIAEAVQTFGFWFKYIFTFSLAIAATWLALRLARPGANAVPVALLLLAAPFMLGIVVLAEYLSLAPDMRAAKAVGISWASCLTFIPLLSLPILGAALIGLRNGAPERPAVAGAVAGLMAGGFGAAIYAVYCIENSALFLATWYPLAIGAVAAAGALLGGRLLRW